MEHWTTGLVKQGLYYEGWVSDLDSVLASHSRETVTSYGTRRSTKNAANLFEEDKENCKSEVCSIQVLRLSVCIVFFSGSMPPKIVLEQRHCDAFRQHTILCIGEQALRMPLWSTLF